MNTYQKSFLIVAFAVIFAGGCAFNNRSVAEQKKNAVEEVVATTTQEVVATSTEAAVDASDWKTYRNEELGFEVKIPSTWKEPAVSYYGDGSVLWENGDDSVGLSIERLAVNDQASKEFHLLSLKDDEKIELNGLQGYQKIHVYKNPNSNIREDISVSYADELWLMSKDVFYVIRPGSYHGWLTEGQINNWKEIVSTFKTFKSMAVDLNGVSTVRDELVKLEMQIPNTWMRVDRKFDGFSVGFVSKGRDPIFEINTINLVITKGSNLDLFKKEYKDSWDGYNVYETLDQLNLDARDHFDIKPTFQDYSGQDRPSFWGDCVKVIVKDGEDYYKIWYMSSGDTQERVEGYDQELKKFLETLEKF